MAKRSIIEIIWVNKVFNYQRCIAVTVIVFCLMAVVSVAATNNATTTQFMESSWSFFSPSPNQSNQNVDNQPHESGPFVYLFTTTELPTSYTNLWDYSFDQYGKPADYKIEYEDLIKQGEYIYKENLTAGSRNFRESQHWREYEWLGNPEFLIGWS